VNPWIQNQFRQIVSAFCLSFGNTHSPGGIPPLEGPYNDLTEFVASQHSRMAGYLRTPVMFAAIAFDLASVVTQGKRFHKLERSARLRLIESWKDSRVSAKRDLIRYFESLSVLELLGRLSPSREETHSQPIKTGFGPADAASQGSFEVIVIGSGPGGAITATLLAEAGRNVLMIEEGHYLGLDSCTAFSRNEMVQKYRNSGQTLAMGRNKIAYVEGRCVGGGSEINSGLYHRTPPEVLDQWRREYGLQGVAPGEMNPHFEASEKDVSVSLLPPGMAPAASLRLQEGAARMNWKSLEVPRWFKYNPSLAGGGRRQSMTETFIPRFLRAGGRLLSNTRVDSFRMENGTRWRISASTPEGYVLDLRAENLFVCGGAIQTPALLRKSGITTNVGDSLHLHPTVKVIAQFPEAVNSAAMGVPVHQVKEFQPRFTFGCAISSPAYLALGLLDHPNDSINISSLWPQLASYYAMITGTGSGTIRSLPGFQDPLVRFHLTDSDRRDLGAGLHKLCQALFAAGAEKLYPAIARVGSLSSADELSRLPNQVPTGMSNLMTIHLFSSCPMGENKSKCAADSFGRVHGFKNLFVADASLLCSAPGVNPQGSIMAFARRNALHFLKK